MSITVNCDVCGKEKTGEAYATGKPEPVELWSVLVTATDYRPCGTGRGIEKKEYHICVECTRVLKEQKKLI